MKLGFVSAILADLDLDGVLEFASQQGFGAVELMSWPKGKAERRYAGVTHVDSTAVDSKKALGQIANSKLQISALGYYPNPLVADEKEAAVYLDHIKKVISAAKALGIKNVNTFIGRDHTRSADDNWKVFAERWPSVIKHAEKEGVKVGIENCPMLFSKDEWPGGKNLGYCPAHWRRMFEIITSANFGLNYDPSHMIWQHMDPLKPIHDFREKIFHVHAKDVRLDQHRLNEVGILAAPLEYHAPKLPGLGDVPWGPFFSALTEIGYDGPVCIEVEDRAYEGSLERRKLALIQSKRFLEQYMVTA